MLDFLKYMLGCLIQISDYLVGNVDKTSEETTMAWVGLFGVAIFTAGFSVMLLKICPKEWKQIKAFSISVVTSFIPMIIYFIIAYLI